MCCSLRTSLYMAEAIRDGLRLEAIAADIAGDGDAALELLSVNAYDIAVLDRDIPDLPVTTSPNGSSLPAAACRSSCLPLPTVSTTRPPGSSSEPTTTSRSRSNSKNSCSQAQAPDRRRAHNRPPGAGDRRSAAGSVPPRGLPRRPLRRADLKQFAVSEVLVAEGGVVSAEEL